MAWLRRVWNTLRPGALYSELDEELQHHLDLRAHDLERAGMSAEDARAARVDPVSALRRE